MSGALLLVVLQLCPVTLGDVEGQAASARSASDLDGGTVEPPDALVVPVVRDAGTAEPKMEIEDFGAQAGNSSLTSLESFDSAPADAGSNTAFEGFQNNAPPSNTRLYGLVRALGAVDTSFDSFRDDPLPENVAEFRSRAYIGADVKFSEALRAKIEARAIYRAVTQRAFQRTKATLEPLIGDTFVDLYTQKVDLRVGWQVVPFGANPVFAPADSLNPRDFRESLLLAEPEDLKIPNFAVRANFNLGKAEVTAAYFPFFEPDRYNVFGQDEAFLQPDFGQALPFKVDPSIEDQVQPRVLETERPKAYPWLGDVGLRAQTKLNEVTVGASWIWGYEKVPEVTLDPELARVLSDRAAGRPPNEAASLSVQNRFNAGEQLAHGRYQRQHVLSLEASTLIKSAQIDGDLSYIPEQTLVDDRFNPIRLSTVTWVLGVTQASDSDLLYNITYIGMAIPGVEADQLLLILEPTTARGAARTAILHGVIGTVGYRFLDRKLEATVRGAVEYRGFAVAPRVKYQFTERITGILEAEIYQGKKYSPFGYFDRNDQVLAGVEVALF